jgi:hypothetical protein
VVLMKHRRQQTRSVQQFRDVSELARFLVRNGVGEDACVQRLSSEFPDADAARAFQAALVWKMDRDNDWRSRPIDG